MPVWNKDGATMTDLRTLRLRGRQSVELTRGVRLYADAITFTDKARQTGVARGKVFLDVEPSARYEWMAENGYAEEATFDKKNKVVFLSHMPILERELMTMVATAPYTKFALRWDAPQTQLSVHGPTRTDFAQSHPIPAQVTLPVVALTVPTGGKRLPELGLRKL
ncbi:MAG: hypothetical protein ACOYMN_13670 [Roseimicrobium sp.]